MAVTSPGNQPLDFDTIYLAWYDRVVRWARRWGGDSDSEDLAQEVFLIVRRRLVDFHDANLGGWLYRITRNRARDYGRLKWSQAFRDCSAPDELITMDPDPCKRLELKERAEQLERRWARLREQEKTVITLIEVHGWSGERVAAELQVPLNTLWSTVRRARMKLMDGSTRRAVARRSSLRAVPCTQVRECA